MHGSFCFSELVSVRLVLEQVFFEWVNVGKINVVLGMAMY
jgi:hypothetical protein